MKAKLIVTAMVVAFGALTVSVLAQEPQVGRPNVPLSGRQQNPGLGPVIRLPDGQYVTGEEGQLALNADDLVRRLATAKNAADKDELKAQLQKVLGQQFDLRQKRHTQEIEALEAKVKRLKELVQKRQESRADIITKRLDQLQRDAEGLGW